MRSNYMGAFLLVLGVLLLPGSAHANEGPCNADMWCGSFLTFDSDNNLITGYSVTQDWYYWEIWVEVDTELDDPGHDEVSEDWDEERDFAEVDIYTPAYFEGYYSLYADHYWSGYGWVGSTSDSAYAAPVLVTSTNLSPEPTWTAGGSYGVQIYGMNLSSLTPLLSGWCTSDVSISDTSSAYGEVSFTLNTSPYISARCILTVVLGAIFTAYIDLEPQPYISVAVGAADIQADNIQVTTTGPTGASGILTVKLNGDSTVTLASETQGPGTHSYNFNRLNLPNGQFTSVSATWNPYVSAVSDTRAVSFRALGSTHFSTYNTPYESQCSGGAAPAFIFTSWSPSSCIYYTDNLNSNFMSTVSTEGTGASVRDGLLLTYPVSYPAKHNYCTYPPGANASNTFVSITSVKGQCGSVLAVGMVATNPGPRDSNQSDWQCNDSVLVVDGNNANKALMTATDRCPGCSTPGHIDTYSSSQACGKHDLSDYGDFNAIRLR